MQNTNIGEKLVNVGSDLTLEKAQEIAGLHEMPNPQAKTKSHSSGENFNGKFHKETL